MVAQNRSAQRAAATVPTQAFSGDRTDEGGEISAMPNHLLALADFATGFSSIVPEGSY